MSTTKPSSSQSSASSLLSSPSSFHPSSHTYDLGLATGSVTLTVSNIQHHVSLKLTRETYLLWRFQFMPVFYSQGLYGFVDGSLQAPPQTQPDGTPNPSYINWFKVDQTVQSWLLSTLSPPPLGLVLGLSTAQAIWSKLEHHYASQSHSWVMHMRFELQTIRRGALSMADYLDKIKTLSDNPVAVGDPVTPRELVFYTLGGLGTDFEPFIQSVTARKDDVSFDELHSLLLTQEHRLALSTQLSSLALSSALPSAIVAVKAPPSSRGGFSPFPSRGRGHGRGRGGHGASFQSTSVQQLPQASSTQPSAVPSPSSSRLQCQLCNKKGQTAP